MKKLNYFFVLILFSISTSYAQVGIGTTSPNASSMLDITSTNSGVLIPRMTLAQKTAIASPATGLLIYQTNGVSGFWYFDGTIWTTFGGADNDWTINGTNMYNANGGNVGVGNTAPSTQFHVTGTTVPGSAGGMTILYSNNFSTGALSNTLNAGNTCTTSPNIWHVTTVNSTQASCTTCTAERAYIKWGACVQDQTLKVGNFTPTTTSINVSFNYGYKHYNNGDSFVVTLYNETTGTTTSTPLSLTSTSINATYSGALTVVAGNNYSLRFRYKGSNSYDASLDDILVTENQVAVAGSYVLRLEDGQQQNGYVLTSDANGNATWKNPSSGSGGGSDVFINGLTKSGVVKLGGALTENTAIGLGTYNLAFNGSSTGYFELQGNNRRILRTNAPADYISFGGGAPTILPQDNTTFRDTGNNLYTMDFVAGFWTGNAGGTAIEMGSIEYIVDGNSEFFFSNSVSPITTNILNLGNAGFAGPNRYWNNVFANNLVTSGGTTYSRTSGKSAKKMKGLAEIMQLKPFEFREESKNIGSRMTTTEENDLAIGFNATELLEVIPEAVKTSDWYTVKEGEDLVKMQIENPNGIMYNQIIPVAVKAIQEQQDQIELLKTAVEELKEQNKILMQLLNKE
ncbi:hypothetical protein [Flavobacterium sp.]|jgi:hypothetical protein|uniref:hypothetical protein n=1 Tax=Flavobacterium sp. TaxID=239 RepID=UPI002A825CD5|nr:hypothetical protein [Flavobacterium sp.]